MKKITILLALLFAMNFAKAQYVTIPDANFVLWLNVHFPSAMNGNQMDTTNALVTSASYISVSGSNISDLTGVQYFTSMDHFMCSNNNLTSLPNLPNSMTSFYCSYNNLTNLPNLPNSLITFWCDHNQLNSLPTLPSTLNTLFCFSNQITSLPSLPNSLSLIYCYNNQLSNLPTLPVSLQYLNCNNNLLTNIPLLPAALEYLLCNSNQLSGLPNLSDSLRNLDCSYNIISIIPPLPLKLRNLICNNNLLTSLPTLVDSIFHLDCSYNNISCFPVFPPYIAIYSGYFTINNNPFTCLPNYIPAMDAATLAYPLCISGDTINNINNCNGAEGVSGVVYTDNNTNCMFDIPDLSLVNFHEILYDNSGNLLSQTYSLANGIYNFSVPTATYTVKIDTVGMPYQIQCPYPGADSTVTLTIANPLANNVNFNVECKPGFDIGTQAIIHNNQVSPGLQHRVNVFAGDLSQWYNLNCALGVSGQVQITINGPVTFTGIAPGALTPTIAGNVYTYNIADFGSINNTNAFGLLLNIDTNATISDTICVNVSVTPTIGDNNTINNNFNYCYSVVSSFDPNYKEVYPVNVLQGFQDYFTYTVHFQNTGNASAQNIRVTDVLDSKLDLSTFQLINYSHQNTLSLNGNNLTVRFPNIMLPDSASNFEASQGFFQYRIKPIAGLISGTQIHNTASIFFDYNAPVITNTTTNLFVPSVSIQENKPNITLNIYPNPANSSITISTPLKSTIEILNIHGQILKTITTTDLNTKIDVSNFASGVYIVKAKTEDGVAVRRFVKE